MFCQNCGNQLDDKVKFCLYCGTPTVAASYNPDAPAAHDPASVDTKNDFGQIPYTAPSSEQAPLFIGPMQYTTPLQPAPVKKTRPKMTTALTIVLSCVFGLLAFSFMIYGTAGLAVRSTLSQNLISQEIASPENNPADIVIGDLVTKESVIEYLEEQDINTDVIDEDMTLAEFIASIADLDGLTDEDVSDILERSEIMPYIGSIAEAYEIYILTGESENRKLLSTDYMGYNREIRPLLQ